MELGDRLRFVAGEDHRSDWDGPKEFEATVVCTNLSTALGPSIDTAEKIGDDETDVFYLSDNWQITVIDEKEFVDPAPWLTDSGKRQTTSIVPFIFGRQTHADYKPRTRAEYLTDIG